MSTGWEGNRRVQDALRRQSEGHSPRVALSLKTTAATKMNKAEAAYATTHLEPMKRAGQVVEYKHEAIGLRLSIGDPGPKQRRVVYWPDFYVLVTDGARTWVELHEVKGHERDDWLVKWAIARDAYPEFRFRCFSAKRRRGAYCFEETRAEREVA